MFNIRRKNKFFLFFLLFSAVTLLTFLLPDEVIARAGGAGGRGRDASWMDLVLLPFFIMYSAIITYYIRKKSRDAEELLKKLAERDKIWDLESMKGRIGTAFFRIQEAWMQRDQTLAKDYMSASLFKKHESLTDKMLSEHKKNVLEKIELSEIRIVETADFKDDSADRIWAYIKGSMIDYTVNSLTLKLISGDPAEPECFRELWKFIRGPEGWVLDKIESNVSIRNLINLASFSENNI